ncbi:MAG: hypothetical protein ACREU6_16385 [Steroidobacteraceae bacterium]
MRHASRRASVHGPTAGTAILGRALGALRLALIAAASLLAGCGENESEPRQGWVLHSQIRFFSADLRVARDSLPRTTFRLFFPYIAGDLYGPATTGDFIHPAINADLRFEIDFARVQQDLARSLEPTQFSLDYLKIDPPDARIARLAPLALQPDGIEQVATTDWIDAGTHERLLLVYVDRPARITGALVRDDYTIRYNVRATTPGYIWIARRQTDDGEQMYTEVQKPQTVVLALTPPLPAKERISIMHK